MISYAQNFEDVMLARVFGDRKEGFYVDIGACFPDIASVTKHFYDLGWSGINIEPMAEPYERLAMERPRDVNLKIAIAACTGDIAMFEGPSVGESSVLRPNSLAQPIIVPCLTLADLCRQQVTRPIDFLKIDVEGLELDVVMSGDWVVFRPTVIVIEVTLSWSTKRRPDSVEIGVFLASHGYTEIYFDGLNAFYLAAEAGELAAQYSCPPNVLDRFVQAREVELAVILAQAQSVAQSSEAARAQAEAELIRVQQKLSTAQSWGQSMQAALQGKEKDRQQLHEQLRLILNSRSWRITRPLRFAKPMITRCARKPVRLLQSINRRSKALVKSILRKYIPYLTAHPAFKAWLIRQAKRLPSLEQRLRIVLRQRLIPAEISQGQFAIRADKEPQHPEAKLFHVGDENLIASVRQNIYPDGLRSVSSEQVLQELTRVISSLPKNRER